MAQLDVILPAYNESDHFGAYIARISSSLDGLNIPYRLIIVSDGRPVSAKNIQELKKHCPVIVDHSQVRRGYGPSILKGFTHVRSQYVLHTDTDGQYDPADIRTLWNMRGQAQVIRGIRNHRADPAYRLLGSAAFYLLFQLLYGSGAKDPSSPFVLYEHEVIKPNMGDLVHVNEGFWWGFTAMCRKRGISTQTVPIKHFPRKNSDTNIYLPVRLPSIAVKNLMGLIRLKFS